MENGTILDQIGKVLKKSRGEPLKFIELISCILDLNREGKRATCPKVVRALWSEEWKEAEDKVEFEKVKWNLLCKRRREINERTLKSDMCFSFFY